MKYDDKIYLYILHFKKRVVYIGITTYVLFRYQKHCEGSNEADVPDLTIAGCFVNRKDALIAESTLVKYFVAMNCKLFNHTDNPCWNRIKARMPENGIPYKAKRKSSGWARPIVEKAMNDFYERDSRSDFHKEERTVSS